MPDNYNFTACFGLIRTRTSPLSKGRSLLSVCDFMSWESEHVLAGLSCSMVAFLRTIDELQAQGVISQNAHFILKDLVRSKESSFFDLVVVKPKDGGLHHIDHLDAILESTAERILSEKLYHNCSYETAKAASQQDRLLLSHSTSNSHNNYHDNNNNNRILTGHRTKTAITTCKGPRHDEEEDYAAQSSSFVYGEIEVASFMDILNHVPVSECCGGGDDDDRTTIFYDLGSGSGRAVYVARLLRDFDRCVGVELLPALHTLATSVQTCYEETFVNQQTNSQLLPWSNVAFYNQDIVEFDWSDGKVVFLHSTCFDLDLLQLVFRKANNLRPGSYLITFRATGIDKTAFRLLLETRKEMSWGEADVFIFQRR